MTKIFDDWWCKEGGQDIATRVFSEQAEKNIAPELAKLRNFNPEDNTFESNQLEVISNNMFWDEVDRLARENNLHIKPYNYEKE